MKQEYVFLWVRVRVTTRSVIDANDFLRTIDILAARTISYIIERGNLPQSAVPDIPLLSISVFAGLIRVVDFSGSCFRRCACRWFVLVCRATRDNERPFHLHFFLGSFVPSTVVYVRYSVCFHKARAMRLYLSDCRLMFAGRSRSSIHGGSSRRGLVRTFLLLIRRSY